MSDSPTWVQIGGTLLAGIVLLVAVLRIVAADWYRTKEEAHKALTLGLAELNTRHEADIKAVYKEIQMLRETWHKQNQETGLLIGRVSNQMDTLKETVAELRGDHASLVDITTKLDRTVAVLIDRMNRRRSDKEAGDGQE